MDNTQQLFDFCTPELLKEKLIIASCYIAVYENFKSTIVENVKYFYWSGLQDGKEQFNHYERDVLSKVEGKKNRQIRATLLWFRDENAITQNDIIQFNSITDLRNELGHNMLSAVYEGLPKDILDIYFKMIDLYTKITKWWIKEIEVPISGEYTANQYDTIDWDGVTSSSLEFIRIMTDVAFTGNEEYLKHLQNNN